MEYNVLAALESVRSNVIYPASHWHKAVPKHTVHYDHITEL